MLKNELGKKGEDFATEYLLNKGFTLVGRNVKIDHLETDIIVKNEKYILFVEVKTRKQYPSFKWTPYGRPSSAVDYKKKVRLFNCANMFLHKNKEICENLIPRIDIIEIYADPKSEDFSVLKCFHMENALK